MKKQVLQFFLPFFILTFLSNNSFSQTAAALDFDGSNDYVDITPVIPYTNDFTIEAWINTSQTSGVLFAWGDPIVNNYTTFEVYSNRLRLSSGMNGSLHYSDGSTIVSSGVWTHVAVTRSGNQISLYVNGNLDGSYVTTNRSTPSTSSIGAGLLNNIVQNFYKGTIDNLRIWNRPLCQAEINNNRNAENPGNTSGLVAHYKFNQGIANINNGTITTALDNMGIYNGSLVSFTLNGTQSNWVSPGGVAQNSNSTFFPNNTSAFISGFSPTTAFSGQLINISGGNFTGSDNVSAVYFGATPASAFIVPSSTQILATVGGGNTGVLKLNVGCGIATASGFTYLQTLSIAGFSPSKATPGQSITISGSGFNSSPGLNLVLFDGLPGTVVSGNTNLLVVQVPFGVSNNNRITVYNGTSSLQAFSTFASQPTVCANSILIPSGSNTTGINPGAIRSADLNKDGILDLAVIFPSSNQMKVYIGSGNGAFSLFNTVYIGSNPYSLDVGDFDNDGDLDMVVGTFAEINILSGDGTGNFQWDSTIPTGDDIPAILLADFNNDNQLDIVYSGFNGGNVVVMFGDATGNFNPGSVTPVTAKLQKLKIADFNKDGSMDVLTIDPDNQRFYILLGKGNGTFQSPVAYTSSDNFDDVAVGDFNNDTYLDAAFAQYAGNTISVFSGAGNGTFSAIFQYPTNNPMAIETADLNGDGRLDLIISNDVSNVLTTLKGNGDFTFGSEVTYTSLLNAQNLCVGDYNNDNRIDVVASNYGSFNISYYLNSCTSLPKISHNGLWFDGVNDNVTINRPIQNDFTISFWMKTNSTFVAGGTKWFDGAGIIDAENSTSNSFDFGISMSKGYLRYGSGDFSTDYTDEGGTAINDNKWHHILVTRSETSGDVQLYIDGVRDIATTQVIGPLSGTPKVMFGRVQTIPQNAFEGQLDDIRFYDKVLSAAEIADTSIWNRDANTSDANLVAYYKLDRDPIVEDEFTAKDFKGGNDGKVDYLNSNGPLFTRSVTSTADDYSAGTLRWAIRDFTQGTDQLSGKNYIDFSLQEVDPNTIQSIDLRDSMSIKSDMILDGYSAYGSSKNKQSVGNDAQLRIAINFLGLNPSDVGIQLNGARNSIIRGLSFGNMPNYFPDAYTLGSIGSSGNNSISGCWFGIYPDGTSSPNTNGIYINSDQGYNLIGGALPEHKNIISNNEYNGIVLRSSHNEVSNNYIGTNSNGSSAMSNNASGVIIAAGTSTLIKENLISGNYNGILGNGTSSQNTIVGNFIGTDASGANPLPNTEGIVLGDGGVSSTIQYYIIGDTTTNNGNIIAYNTSNAISLNGLNSTVDNIRISGNSIFENGYGIALANSANADKVPPSVTSAKTFLISGTCEADDWVEIYYDLPAFGLTNQGRRFLGVANTNGTTWTFPTKLAIGDRVTALAIKNPNQGGGKSVGLGSNAPSGFNTSEFSTAATVNSSTPISQPVGNRGVYLEGNITSGSNLTTSFVPTNATDNVTLEAWVKLDSFPTNYLRFIAYNGNSSLNGYGIYVDPSGLVSCFVGGAGRGGVNFIGSTISLKSWNHVALVRESGFWYLYLNGVSQTYNPLSFPQNLAPDTPTDNLVIGNGFGETNPWAGQIDEVKIFNSARTASDILLDMASTNPDGAVGYWNFEEQSGNIALDQTLSGNNATFIHNPLRSLRVTDISDNGIAGLGSLRQAINDANLDSDTDYIDFSIQQTSTSSISIIQPTIPLEISESIVLDGYSAYGSSQNTAAFLSSNNAIIRTELDFTNSVSTGIRTSGNQILIKGISIHSAVDYVIQLDGLNNSVSGCYIGIRGDGTAGVNSSVGIGLGENGGHTFGYSDVEYPADFNVVANFNYYGLRITSNQNTVKGNYIGTDITGLLPWGGVNSLFFESGNGSLAHRNLIAGNSGEWTVRMDNGPNTITGNFIGIKADLSGPSGNSGGVTSYNFSSGNVVGGDLIGEANIIAYNPLGGISLNNYNFVVKNNSIFCNDLSTVGIFNAPVVVTRPTLSGFILGGIAYLTIGNLDATGTKDVYFYTNTSCGLNQGELFNFKATAVAAGIDTYTYAGSNFNLGDVVTVRYISSNGSSIFSDSLELKPPIVGQALDFDGVDDEVVLPVIPALDFSGTDEFSIETWVKTDANNNASILEEVGGVCIGGNQMGISVVSGSVQFYIDHWCASGPHIVRTASSPIQAGIWAHVICVYKNTGEKKIYVNGVLQSLLTIGGTPNPLWSGGNSSWKLGTTNATYSSLGLVKVPLQIDEFRIWNRELCQAEIANNLNAEVPGNRNGLVVRYDFNQGFTGIDNSLITSLVDSSGNGYDASLVNFQLNGTSSNWIAPGAVLTGSTTASVNCIPGAALDFTNSSSYVATNRWSDTLKNFTIEAHVYWRGGNGLNQVIAYNGLSSSNGYGLVIQNGSVPADQLTILMGGVLWNTTGTVLTTNVWNKISIVNDNGNWSLYLNGSLLSLASYTAVPNSIAGISNSLIGNNEAFTSGFNGTIDNFRFWNRPLCQTEINAHLSCEKPANSAGLIARYDFNSGIAGDNNAGVVTAIDSSGNGNHGTLTNFALTSTISNWVAPGSVLSGSTCAGVSIPAGGTWTWVGGNSDDWFSPCNWDKLSVPTAASNVVIPGGTLNQPLIRIAPAYCNKIDINTSSGGLLNLDSSSSGQLIITQ